MSIYSIQKPILLFLYRYTYINSSVVSTWYFFLPIRLIAVILLGSIFYSCSNNNTTTFDFQHVKNLTFKSGFKSGNAQIELINGKEYVCIGEYRNEKRIALHSLKGNNKITIDLRRLDLFNEQVMAFELINLDTILVLPYYSSKLYCLNQHGDIWKIIDLHPYLPKNGKYELKRSATPFLFQNNSLIFSLEYLSDSEDDLYTYRKKRNAAPILLKVEDIFANNLEVTYGLENLYNNFSDANHVTIEGNKFTFLKDQIIFNSAYSDSLYIIDPYKLKVQHKIKLSSKYSEINIRPITNRQQRENSDLVNSNFRTNGQIRSVKYYKKRDWYLVFVSHKPVASKTDWSIIVLDKNFNQIKELIMDKTKYAHFGLISEQGVLISSYYETLWDADTNYKNTYALFDFL